MKITKREAILLTVLTVLIVLISFYAVYLNPLLDEMKVLKKNTSEISEKIKKQIPIFEEWTIYTKEKEKLIGELDSAEDKLPDRFNDTEALRFIEKVIYPHTKDIKIHIDVNDGEGKLTFNVMRIEYEVERLLFMDILKAFDESTLSSRFLNYEYKVISRSLDPEYTVSANNPMLDIKMNLEIITR